MRYEAEARQTGLDHELRDLLDRKTRELEESEARFRTLFEGIPEIVLVHDPGGTILLANDIGARVMDHLRELDKVAYVRFASVYRKFEDVDEFLTELKNLIGRAETKTTP